MLQFNFHTKVLFRQFFYFFLLLLIIRLRLQTANDTNCFSINYIFLQI